MFCSKCGTKAIEGAAFCQNCGAKLQTDTSVHKFCTTVNDCEPVGSQFDTDEGTVKKQLDVTLAGVDDGNKIKAIKAVRELTGLGLSESKDIVENAPTLLKECVSGAEAESIKALFREIGAVVTFSDQEGNNVDIVMHCKACGAVLEDDSNVCKACGSVFISSPKGSHNEAEFDFKQFTSPEVRKEIAEDFKQMPTSKKVLLGAAVLFAAILILIILRAIFSSPIALMVVAVGGYFVYYRWGAEYITAYKYRKRIKNLHLPAGTSAQTLLEALSGKFNYPNFKGVRYGDNGECIIDGRYSAYTVTIYDNGTADLDANLIVDGIPKRTIMLECMAICGYLNKFFNPSATDDVVKDMKILNAVEKRRKIASVVSAIATVLIIAVIALEAALPGSLHRIMVPGAEVRGAYLTQYSDEVTIEEAFDNYFDNGKWSTYKETGYSYVVFTGNCEYLGSRADIRLTFKLTGENFRVDSLDVNGVTQGALIMYGLLSSVYEGY